MQAALTGNATPHEAAERQDALEHDHKQAYQAARAADPCGNQYESRSQAAECDQATADVVHETLANGIRRSAGPTADFLSQTEAEAHTAEAKRACIETADQFWARKNAGIGPDAIAWHQEEIVGAREYANTAATTVRDLKELDEPGLTPEAPHPDANLAAKSWHESDHGIRICHPDDELQVEPEAC